MELCTTSLHDWMKKEGFTENGLNPERVISEFIPSLKKMVQQMRSKNIVHFDLNPKNILKCGGVWKVADFDDAEIVKNQKEVSQRGTRGYTDPAVLEKRGGLATPMTDLYSVGAILAKLVTGKRYADPHEKNMDKLKSLTNSKKYGALGGFIQKLLNKEFKSLDEFYEEA